LSVFNGSVQIRTGSKKGRNDHSLNACDHAEKQISSHSCIIAAISCSLDKIITYFFQFVTIFYSIMQRKINFKYKPHRDTMQKR